MASSDELACPAPRVGGVFRLLMQVRLLIVGVTLLLLVSASFTVGSALAVAAAASSSWLGAHYWQRIMGRVLRHPILLALDVVVAFIVLELGGLLGPFFLFTVITSAIAGLLYRWRGVAYFCLLQILCYFAALTMTPSADVWTFQALVGQPAYYPLVGFVGIRVRRLLDEQATMAESQRQAEIVTAAAEERTRLARELHDSLAKTLRGIAMSAQALPMWLERSPQRAAQEADRIISAAETGSREARELVAGLRSDKVDQPLAASVRAIAEEWANETGTAVRTEVDEVELTLLGRYEAGAVLEEALTNVRRHAGAKHVVVVLRQEEEHVVLTVQDDGRGFDFNGNERNQQPTGHYGLIGMQERVARAGGCVTVRSALENGTTVIATLPVTVKPQDETSIGGH